MTNTQTKQWQAQAELAIRQGQTLEVFVAHCHLSNRPIARVAYINARKKPIADQIAESFIEFFGLSNNT